MRSLFFVLLVLTSFNGLKAQNNDEKKTTTFTVDKTVVSTLDATIKSLYDVISGEKNEPRNWKQFKFLFKPDAKLIAAGKDKNGNYRTHFMTPEDYIKSSGKWLVNNGFIETEIHRNLDTFGNIAHAFSTYHAFHSATDEEPFMRGINSIQLTNDGSRWWIVNIFWTQESRRNPIPDKYLP